jgi:predicted ribosome quality control (RQC) complex YloA/Tae2 family protein
VALDWIGLDILARELAEKLTGYRVQEVFQPADGRLAIELYGGEREYLLIDTDRENSFLYLAFAKEENPAFPPAFCTLLRKYLTGLRLSEVQCIRGDRVCVISFSDENGICCYLRISLSGRMQDISLVLADGIMPGSMLGAKKLENVDPFSSTHPQPLLQEINWDIELARQNWDEKNISWFVSQARELTPELMEWLISCLPFPENSDLNTFFNERITEILEQPVFQLFADELGLHGFSIYPLPAQTENTDEKTILRPSLLSLLNEFCPGRKEAVFLRRAKSAVFTKIRQLLGKAEKRKKEFEEQLALCKNYREFERNGDLLNSQRNKIRPYQKSVTVVDFYSENYREKEIPLEQRLSVNENIKRYFQKARKYKRGIEKTEELIAAQEKKIRFYERLQAQLRHETDHHIVEQQMEKLTNLGVLKKSDTKTKKTKKTAKNRLRMFYSSEQAEIYAGRNNRENDFLMRVIGSKDDLWFHIRDVSGAHILMKKNSKITNISIAEAAQLAAYFSQKKNESKAEVIYTPLKYVHKVPGGEPGKASVIQHETITVPVDLNIVKKLEKNNRFINEEIAQN